jgi:pantoate--beta-alanine ligase
MHIVESVSQMKEFAGSVLVPTMGALHAGHRALLERARDIAVERGAIVVASIFVNPTQFGPGEDYQRYPRQLEADTALARQAGVDVVFAPQAEAMYPPGSTIPVPPLPAVARLPRLEDAMRPSHFAGVCQVVARLFDVIQPSAAVFGEKDYQQLMVIRAMVAQEGRWGRLQIIAHPTVREPDGLALSSRNAYLKPEQRAQALGLSRALRDAAALHRAGDSAASIEAAMRRELVASGLAIDYAVVRDAETLLPPGPNSAGAALRALIAARAGSVRLIDNIDLGSGESKG